MTASLHKRIADLCTIMTESYDAGLPYQALLLMREAMPVVKVAEANLEKHLADAILKNLRSEFDGMRAELEHLRPVHTRTGIMRPEDPLAFADKLIGFPTKL
jgi:hypothetical protein